MPEQLIGTVVHFFKGPSVAVVRLTDGELAVGDRVRFHGHTTEFTEQVNSMERSPLIARRYVCGRIIRARTFHWPSH